MKLPLVILSNVWGSCVTWATCGRQTAGADSAVVVWARWHAWKKVSLFSPVLALKGASLNLKRWVYDSCVRSCMMEVRHDQWWRGINQCWRGQRCECLATWMCAILRDTSLREKKTSAESRDKTDGHAQRQLVVFWNEKDSGWLVTQTGKKNWVWKYMYLKIDGAKPRGRPRKTRLKVVMNYTNGLGLYNKCGIL